MGIAPANYNIYVPTKTHEPIAWMQTTGMGDGTCPWVNGSSTTQGAKYIAIEHATDNGCTIPADIPIWQSGEHVCYDFQGCRRGYPTKACTFNGGHTNIANDSGSNMNWIAARVLGVLHAVLISRFRSCWNHCPIIPQCKRLMSRATSVRSLLS